MSPRGPRPARARQDEAPDGDAAAEPPALEGGAEALAAVDLGSNSFHMVVARRVRDDVEVVDRLRERVALGSGLTADKRLDPQAVERALACLARFGQRLRGIPAEKVRAVGTNTLREARDAQSFLERAEDALGHRIEVIAGPEEARLIYLGVAHDVASDAGRRLVVDIGGGSTECILGERFEPLFADSLHMGCVKYQQQFFAGERCGELDMNDAVFAARLELESIQRRYLGMGWDVCTGSSGTIKAVEAILSANGWSGSGVSREGVEELKRAVVGAGGVAGVARIPGVQADRAPVLAGGVAILSALFDSLRVEQMSVSQGALREGLLYDLLGRIRHEDVRDRTVRRMLEAYGIDAEQAARVERTALHLFDQVRKPWKLGLKRAGEEADPDRRMLSWGARLHEIGLSISHSGNHKHGAYIVENANLPGFSRTDQQELAALIAAHRRRVPLERFAALAEDASRRCLRLAVLLRIAVRLNRGRSPGKPPRPDLRVRDDGLLLSFGKGWLDRHPLTRLDLEHEAESLEDVGIVLRAR